MTILSPLQTYSLGDEPYVPIQTGKIDLPITRYESGSYVDRRWVKGGSTPVVLCNVNVQPLTERQKLILPEADRTKDWLKIYSPALIRTSREGTDGFDADQFVFEGILYEVAKVRNYSMGVLNHYKALAVSVEKTPG